MTRDAGPDHFTEWAAPYALGALSQWEARAFQEHLEHGCDACLQELGSFADVTGSLGLAAEGGPPSVEVKQRLLARVAELVHASERGRSQARARDLRFENLRSESVRSDDLRFEDLKSESLRLENLRSESLRSESLRFEDLKTRDPYSDEPHSAFLSVLGAKGEWQAAGEGIFVKTLFHDKTSGMATALVKMLPGSALPAHRHLGVEQFFVIEGDCHVHGDVLGPGDYHRAEAGSVHQSTYTETGTVFLLVAPANYEIVDAR